MDNFIENLKMGIDAIADLNVTPETNLTSLEEWDSLALLSTIAVITSEYGVLLTANEINTNSTIQKLFDFVMAKKQ